MRWSLLALAFASSAFASAPLPAPTQYFLGQVYPSGTVYLQQFDSDEGPLPIEKWPKSVKLFCMAPEGCADAAVGKTPRTAELIGAFNTELKKTKDKQGNETSIQALPFSIEGMDDRHDTDCQVKTKLNKAYKYADGDDIYSSISDNCDSPFGAATYKTTPAKNRSYRVIAFAADTKVENAAPQPEKALRPMTAAEKKKVAKEKKEIAGADCTTVPTYLDEAKVLWTGSESGGKTHWRLSRYSSPGCGGHLGTVYLLDVIDGTPQSAPKTTYTLVRAGGLL